MKQWRLGYADTLGVFSLALDYEGVALDRVATLHALTPMLGIVPFGHGGLTLGARYRIAFAHDERRPDAPDQDRFAATLDWLW